ncbi:Mobile element protein [Candidatus Enterovibrio altilux]|uniref:Mobile element protein n=1 Tax=Candidatus Enterovibrio altilux TaxID=1927128 RepID=A0A291BBT6_9GAMM|nr:Mobile element protein [Candidatus Enterovibrio luxaltus]
MTKPDNDRKARLFSDLVITMALIIQRVSSIPLRSLQEFINFVFKLAQLLLSCLHYSCIGQRAKMVSVKFKPKNKGTFQHLVNDSMGLKAYCVGKCEVKKHAADGKRLV